MVNTAEPVFFGVVFATHGFRMAFDYQPDRSGNRVCGLCDYDATAMGPVEGAGLSVLQQDWRVEGIDGWGADGWLRCIDILL